MTSRLSQITLAFLLAALLAATANCAETTWTLVKNGKPAAQIVLGLNAPAPISIAAKDLQSYIKRMSGAELPIVTKPTASTPNTTVVYIAADPADRKLPDETMTITTGRDGRNPSIRLSGASPVGAMYATYRFLELLGVRFFHPEQDYVPTHRDLSVGSLKITESPAYKWRGIQQHTLHPIPATKFLMENQSPKDLRRAYRYVDWLARNRQNYLFWWWVERVKPGDRTPYVRKIVDYAHQRGVNVGMVVGMPFNQQNSYNLMRGTACHSDKEKWTGFLKQGVDEMAAMGVDALCIFFGESENKTFKESSECVTTVDGVQATVDRVEAVRRYVKEKYPHMQITLWVHPTTGMRGNDTCPNYFLLPALCSPDVGAAVHTVQFYNLFDPAPTYGNADFHALRDFAVEQSKVRPVWYWPESAYACGFDDDVPIFLPGYLTGRARDAQFLAGKAVAHITFSTGIEWNYWLIDYAVARYGWDPNKWTSDNVIANFAEIFGPKAGPVVAKSLHGLAAANDRCLVDAAGKGGVNLMTLLTTLIAPRALDNIAGKPKDEVVAWRNAYLPQMKSLTAAYGEAYSSLESVRPMIGKTEQPWFDELSDSVQITYLRCEHQTQVADAFTRRVMDATASAASVERDVTALTDLEARAKVVMQRREQHFRYPTGGPEGNYTALMRPISDWERMGAKVKQYASPEDLYPGITQWVLALPYRIEVVGEVGKRVKVVATIPDDFPVDRPLRLCVQLDDTDSPLEGALEIAGTTIALPESGDGKAKSVKLDIPAGTLKHGANDLWFVFKDNVNGTTRGYYASGVCIAVSAP